MFSFFSLSIYSDLKFLNIWGKILLVSNFIVSWPENIIYMIDSFLFIDIFFVISTWSLSLLCLKRIYILWLLVIGLYLCYIKLHDRLFRFSLAFPSLTRLLHMEINIIHDINYECWFVPQILSFFVLHILRLYVYTNLKCSN